MLVLWEQGRALEHDETASANKSILIKYKVAARINEITLKQVLWWVHWSIWKLCVLLDKPTNWLTYDHRPGLRQVTLPTIIYNHKEKYAFWWHLYTECLLNMAFLDHDIHYNNLRKKTQYLLNTSCVSNKKGNEIAFKKKYSDYLQVWPQ